jgi:hypothetical protein
MQGTRKENALLFYVVFVLELRRKLQKSGRFCVESSVHFVPLDMAKQQERYTISYILSIVDRDPRSSFNVHRSTFDNQQPTTSSTKNLPFFRIYFRPLLHVHYVHSLTDEHSTLSTTARNLESFLGSCHAIKNNVYCLDLTSNRENVKYISVIVINQPPIIYKSPSPLLMTSFF